MWGIPALVRGARGFGALGPAWGTIVAIGIVEIAMPVYLWPFGYNKVLYM